MITISSKLRRVLYDKLDSAVQCSFDAVTSAFRLMRVLYERSEMEEEPEPPVIAIAFDKSEITVQCV